MVAAQIYEIVFIPFQKSVKFCFFWRKMGGKGALGVLHRRLGALGALGALGVLLGRLGALGGFGGWNFFRGGYRMPSMMFSILMVAWNEASIWSTSRPRVLMMWPL